MLPDRLLEILRQLAEALDAIGAPWALVGGIAVSARTEPRFTRDLDVAIATTDDAGAEAVGGALIRRGYGVVWELQQTSAGRMAGLRFAPPGQTEDGDEVAIDLLFASSGVEPEIAARAEALEVVPGLTLPVARIGHLIALKVLARDDVRRPQDLVDLRALARAADAGERRLALETIELIRARGYDRGRDLAQGVAEILDPPGP